MTTAPAFHRILLKLSGEALMGSQGFGVDPEVVSRIAQEVHEIHESGVEIAIVVGGGNFVRGVAASASGFDRVVADHMGMLATVINALALQDALEKSGSYTRVVTAIEMREIAEPFIRRRVIRHLEKGRIVILAGGTGSPYFSTDTAAALRGMEVKAEVILKATKVDGVYDRDPNTSPDAKMFSRISYLDVLSKGLAVMDTTAISLCMDNSLPIIVFNLNVPGNLKRVVAGEKVGSLVWAEADLMVKETLAQTRARMNKVVEDLQHELAAVRTGRASTALLAHLKVDYYGTPTPLKQVATLGVPEPTLITVQPWDASLLPAIEKAIRSSDLGLNPVNDGKILRVPLPPLTEERRKELVKHVHALVEKHRLTVRNLRREANETLKKLLKDKKISEDDERRGLEESQKLTDEFISKLDLQGKSKEQEILEMR